LVGIKRVDFASFLSPIFYIKIEKAINGLFFLSFFLESRSVYEQIWPLSFIISWFQVITFYNVSVNKNYFENQTRKIDGMAIGYTQILMHSNVNIYSI